MSKTHERSSLVKTCSATACYIVPCGTVQAGSSESPVLRRTEREQECHSSHFGFGSRSWFLDACR